MKNKKTIWTSLTGGVSSAAPILLSCCKSGACVGVCASPIASLFGISTASMISSPWMAALEPILIAVSAVSFTVSYYSLYVLPKSSCGTDSCACEPDPKVLRRARLNKAVFWGGLLASLFFLTYFEYTKYQETHSTPVECSTSSCATPQEACCSDSDSTACAANETTEACDSVSSCCAEPDKQD